MVEKMLAFSQLFLTFLFFWVYLLCFYFFIDVAMNFWKTKKLFLYVAVSGAISIGVLSLLSIRWNFSEGFIFQGLLTYLVTLISFRVLTALPAKYESFSKVDSRILSSGIWVGILSILTTTLAFYLCIWNFIEANELFWKIVSSLLIVNFVFFAAVFSFEKWGGEEHLEEK